MSGTDVTSDTSAAAPAADTVEFKLEVWFCRSRMSTGPRRSTRCSAGGWTPTSPPATTTGVTSAAPGSVERLVLVVDDIDVARAELVARDVDVSEMFHGEDGLIHHAGTRGRVTGPDPGRATYGSTAGSNESKPH